jgi:DNA-binding GntR family transcriptional regulator
VFEEHSAIILGIENGDPEEAERAAVANWRKAATRFERVMRDVGERGTFDLVT